MYPNYRNKLKRKSTIKHSFAEIWSNCGFFYMDNWFYCFFCGVKHSNLPIFDCIWKFHHKYSPFCDYVKIKKGYFFDKTICNICMENEKNMLALPCKHVFSCTICSKKLKSCVICRQIISNYLDIFI